MARIIPVSLALHKILIKPSSVFLLLLVNAFLFGGIPCHAQGVLGKNRSALDDNDPNNVEDPVLALARQKVLSIPNLSNPPCSFEISKTMVEETRNGGLAIIGSFTTENLLYAVVAQVDKDKTAKLVNDANGHKIENSLFENKLWVFLVQFNIYDLHAPPGNNDDYLVQALDAQFGPYPSVAFRPSDRKLVLLTEELDHKRLRTKAPASGKVERVSFKDFKNVRYASLRMQELDYFKSSLLSKIEDEARTLSKRNSEFSSLFDDKMKGFDAEYKGCKKKNSK